MEFRKSCENQSCRWICRWLFSLIIKANPSWVISSQSVSYSMTDLFVSRSYKGWEALLFHVSSFLDTDLIVNTDFFSSFVWLVCSQTSPYDAFFIIWCAAAGDAEAGRSRRRGERQSKQRKWENFKRPHPSRHLWFSFSSVSFFGDLSPSSLINHLLIPLSKCLAVTRWIITGQAGWL